MFKTLHSILVIFQWYGGGCRCRRCGFTFHSGYIPINRFNRWFSCSGSLYIPFWLYSNYFQTKLDRNIQSLHSILVIFQYFCNTVIYVTGRIFTFHSGYIPIHAYIEDSQDVLNFTFHSGYIPIVVLFLHCPMYFHFTFHSGYIPIKTAGLKAALSALYIPFWLYSNTQNI